MKDEVFAYLDALHKKAGANMWEAPSSCCKKCLKSIKN